MIEVQNIAKSFGEVQAVRDVSFSAENGQITTLLGANGSGKTTTFRAICGLMQADAGRVSIDGVQVSEEPVKAKEKLGVFPDSFGLYTRLTTREHIEYFGAMHGLRGVAMTDACDHLADVLKLHDIIDRRAEGFSQGQRMKVALARALVHSPKNMVLDEPARGLDVMSIRMLRSVLKDLAAAGHCILLSSHVMAEVEYLSDKVVIIADGETVTEGSPADLVRRTGSDNLEEAFMHFIGSIEDASGKDAA